MTEVEKIDPFWLTVRGIAAAIGVLCLVGIAVILTQSSSAEIAWPTVPVVGTCENAGATLQPTVLAPQPTYTAASSLVSPLPTPTETPTATPTETPTATPTHTPVPTATPLPTHTATPTETPLPSPTPLPTYTATATPIPLPTATLGPPTPTPVPTPAPPLVLDYVVVEVSCISQGRWRAKFWLTATGGTGEYTFYRDIQRLHGPHPAAGHGYELQSNASSAAVGSFFLESGNQRVQKDFWIKHPNCSHMPP